MPDIVPRTFPGRILTASVCLLNMILVIIYTSNLTSFLTVWAQTKGLELTDLE